MKELVKIILDQPQLEFVSRGALEKINQGDDTQALEELRKINFKDGEHCVANRRKFTLSVSNAVETLLRLKQEGHDDGTYDERVARIKEFWNKVSEQMFI